jgi:hypothetical protein
LGHGGREAQGEGKAGENGGGAGFAKHMRSPCNNIAREPNPTNSSVKQGLAWGRQSGEGGR